MDLASSLSSLFTPERDLVAAILQDAQSKEVLMLGWMNRNALEQTMATGRATFWSRSRNEIWIKGETSGNFQRILSIKYDCDSDALLIQVSSEGPACHTGASSCFHNELVDENRK